MRARSGSYEDASVAPSAVTSQTVSRLAWPATLRESDWGGGGSVPARRTQPKGQGACVAERHCVSCVMGNASPLAGASGTSIGSEQPAAASAPPSSRQQLPEQFPRFADLAATAAETTRQAQRCRER